MLLARKLKQLFKISVNRSSPKGFRPGLSKQNIYGRVFVLLIGTVSMRRTAGMWLKINPQYLFNNAIVLLVLGVGFYYIGTRKQIL